MKTKLWCDINNGGGSGFAYVYTLPCLLIQKFDSDDVAAVEKCRVPVSSPSPSFLSQPSSVPSLSPSITGGTASKVCSWSPTSHLASEAIDGDTNGVFSNDSIANTYVQRRMHGSR